MRTYGENEVAQTSASWLSGGHFGRAKSCLGQSANLAALHTSLAFDVRARSDHALAALLLLTGGCHHRAVVTPGRS